MPGYDEVHADIEAAIVAAGGVSQATQEAFGVSPTELELELASAARRLAHAAAKRTAAKKAASANKSAPRK